MLAVALLALIVIAPYVFELYTFHLYSIRDTNYYSFSGARIWFFITTILGSAVALGYFYRHNFVIYGSAVSVSILIALIYQFCDVRQCYYSGPEGLGWLRLWSLLLLTSFVGIFLGRRLASFVDISLGKELSVLDERNATTAFFFATTVSLFSGFYPVALLYGTLTTQTLNSFLLVWAASVPFLFGGLIIFSSVRKLRYVIYSSATSSVILILLLSGLEIGNLVPLVIIPASILSAILGYKMASKLISNTTITHKTMHLLFSLFLANFFFFAIHPYIDAPMNLSASSDNVTKRYSPTYYAAAFQNEEWIAVKHLEVEMNFDNFNKNSIQEGNFLVAGIGAQSPNCCKDGLDYGYRADVLFSDKGETFLLARAWATCDGNIACSATPWQLRMHEAIVPFALNSNPLMLAMEWNEGWDDREVRWYYRTSGTDWSRYSTFAAPKIENPFFDIGILGESWAFGSLPNPPLGRVYFYQFGVSTAYKIVDKDSSISFSCPAYYLEGTKHCVRDMGVVKDGASHWKVLWKWGVPLDAQVAIDEEKNTVTIGFIE